MLIQDWFETKDYGVGLGLLGTHSKNRMLLQNLGRKPNPEKLEYELRKICKEQEIIIDTAEKIDETNGLSIDPPNVPIEPVDKAQSQSGKISDQANDKLESDVDEIVSGKISVMQSDADDMVSDKLSEMESDADDIVADKLKELELASEELLSGKLKVIRNGHEVNYNDLPKELRVAWDHNRDAYKEIRATHEKLKLMENATEADRAPLVQSIAKLDDQIRINWEAIDAWKQGDAPIVKNELELDHKRINANRKFISTNLKTLLTTTDEAKATIIKAKIQERYDELKNAGETVQPETIDELTKAGIKC